MSSAQNAHESAICPVRAQPSAEIARVECARCRRKCDLGSWKMKKKLFREAFAIFMPDMNLYKANRAFLELCVC